MAGMDSSCVCLLSSCGGLFSYIFRRKKSPSQFILIFVCLFALKTSFCLIRIRHSVVLTCQPVVCSAFVFLHLFSLYFYCFCFLLTLIHKITHSYTHHIYTTHSCTHTAHKIKRQFLYLIQICASGEDNLTNLY